MSFDLAVWHTTKLADRRTGRRVVAALRESQTDGVTAHPTVDAFYAEGDSPLPGDRHRLRMTSIDDPDDCPWSCALDRSPGHVIMSCVWS